METNRDAGRWLVIAIIVATLSISAIVIAVFNMRLGSDRLPQQVVRFLLTVGLCLFLYRGANWARWVAAILFIVADLGGLIGGLATLSAGVSGVVLLAMGLIYLASAVTLLFVPSVREYFGVGSGRSG